MKKLSYLFSLMILVSFLGFISCGGDDDPQQTTEEQQIDNLVGTWATTEDGDVLLDGTNAPGDWSNFTIRFTQQKGVSVSGAPTSEVDIFALSNYQPTGSNTTNFTLQFNGDPNETANVNISGSNMVMTFTLQEGDKLGARVLSVAGDWTFNLVKQ
jgi:hypothetical protein